MSDVFDRLLANRKQDIFDRLSDEKKKSEENDVFSRAEKEIAPLVKSYIKANQPKLPDSLQPKDVLEIVKDEIAKIPPPEKVKVVQKVIEKITEKIKTPDYAKTFDEFKAELDDLKKLLDRPQFMPVGTALPNFGNQTGKFLNVTNGQLSWQTAGVSVGSSVASGTANDVLFIGPTGLLAQSSGFTYLSASNTLSLGVLDTSLSSSFSIYGQNAVPFSIWNSSVASVSNSIEVDFNMKDDLGLDLPFVAMKMTSPTITDGLANGALEFQILKDGLNPTALKIDASTSTMTLTDYSQTIQKAIGTSALNPILYLENTSAFNNSNVSSLVFGLQASNGLGAQYGAISVESTDTLFTSLDATMQFWVRVAGVTTKTFEITGTGAHVIGSLALDTPLSVANGGTGTSSYTNGQILIGNTTTGLLSVNTLTGTTNQITVTNTPGVITLSTPQSLNTGASIQFSLMGLGTTSGASQRLKFASGSLSTCPINFSIGTLKTTPAAGDLEVNVDDVYYTIQTGAARKTFVLTDGTNLTSGRVPFASTNGRLIDDADMTFATDTLTVTKIAAHTLSGNLTVAESVNFVLGTSTGAKIGTATTQKLGFFNKTPVVQPAAYTPTNVTTDRSYDANSTTLDEVADVLGTLIADLQSLGLVG